MEIKNKPWKEAIIEVLQQTKEAMHYADISKEIQKRQLRSKFGATPASSVNTAINDSINKDGEDSPFIKVDAGTFILRTALAASKSPLGKTASDSREDVVAQEAAETGGIIKAFGMFWKRDSVDWISKPVLMGQQQEGADPVNFSDQYGVYLLHDGREVIYVGRMTEKRLAARLSEHTRDRLNGRWDRFSWFGLLAVTKEGKLAETKSLSISQEDIIVTLEALLIEGLEPRQNRKRGDAFRAVEYIQDQDPELLKKRQKHLMREVIEKL